MTIKPTLDAQRRWRKYFLNNGVCPKDINEWEDIDIARAKKNWRPMACQDALEWLAKSDIKTLAEAWEQCPYPSWMLWTVQHMQPDAKDLEKLKGLLRYIRSTSTTKFPRNLWVSTGETLLIANNARGAKKISDCFEMAVADFHWSEMKHKYKEPRISAASRKLLVGKVQLLWGNPWET